MIHNDDGVLLLLQIFLLWSAWNFPLPFMCIISRFRRFRDRFADLQLKVKLTLCFDSVFFLCVLIENHKVEKRFEFPFGKARAKLPRKTWVSSKRRLELTSCVCDAPQIISWKSFDRNTHVRGVEWVAQLYEMIQNIYAGWDWMTSSVKFPRPDSSKNTYIQQPQIGLRLFLRNQRGNFHRKFRSISRLWT